MENLFPPGGMPPTLTMRECREGKGMNRAGTGGVASGAGGAGAARTYLVLSLKECTVQG